MKARLLAIRVAAVAMIVAAPCLFLGTPAHAAGNWIWNNSSGGLSVGVIHIADGVYTVPGKYDVLLPAGQTTTQWWSTAEGVYIGPGYCVSVWENGVYLRDYASGSKSLTLYAFGVNLRVEAEPGSC